MTAFINLSSTGAFCARPNNLPWHHRQTCTNLAPRMTANWPGDKGPAYSKYLSKIPMDRLNKAPVITINHFKNIYKNDAYDSISVRLADMLADEAAGNSLKAGIVFNEEKAPDQSKWAAYYDPATVNEAPHISLYSSPLPLDKHAICVIQTTVPCDIPGAQVLLGEVEPSPVLYKANYLNGVNMAPDIQIISDSHVSVSTTFAPLNIVAANEILNKYRS